MSRRFKYEAPGALRKAALTLASPHNWRSKTRPWIFDNDSGVSFQLAVDEDAVLGRLTSRMTQDEPRTGRGGAGAGVRPRRPGHHEEAARLRLRLAPAHALDAAENGTTGSGPCSPRAEGASKAFCKKQRDIMGVARGGASSSARGSRGDVSPAPTPK